jgi:16S rRNA (adenine1518-N6/adenine1519-N6)-dimethyltransferase
MRPKKSLGQNFLDDEATLDTIVGAAELRPEDTVLEVGPGSGFLTRRLLAAGARVVAVEKDNRLIPTLSKTFSKELSEGRLALVHGDVLEMDLQTLLPEGPYSVVANIPYYITGQLMRMFLAGSRQPFRMVLMVQKEVAERIVLSKKESLLSLSVKAYGMPRYVASVPKELFSPVPKVDSAILAIEGISKNFFKDMREEEFFSLIRKGFAQKRKLLAKNLGVAPEILQNIGLNPLVRAEELSLDAWKVLAKALGV